MPDTYIDRAVDSLIVNKMTQAQYDALPQKSDTEIYLIDDGEGSLSARQMRVMPAASEEYLNRIVQFVGNSTMTYITGYFYRCVLQGGTYVWKKINVQANSGGGGGQEIQFDDLPEATGENVGQILQYVGDDIPSIDSSATISQTVGSGITDLSINVQTFESAEHPSIDEVVDFVCSNATQTNITVSDSGRGFTVTILDQNQIINAFVNAGYGDNLKNVSRGGVNYYPDGMTNVRYKMWIEDGEGQHYVEIYDGTFDIQEPDPLPEESYVIASWNDFVIGSETWQKNNTEVNLEDYGITHSGTVNTGDTLEVVYSAAIPEYKKGYFYINQPKYSDASATISQTVGSGLSDLAVVVGTFVKAEQPVQSGNTSFVCDGVQTTVVPLTVGQDVYGEYIEATINPQVFFTKAREVFGDSVVDNGNTVTLGIIDAAWNMAVCIDGDEHRVNEQIAEDWGIVYNQVPTTGGGATAWLNYTIDREFTWSKNGTTVDLANYGISYSGIPVVGDTLTVAYTAPAPIGYAWNQINVQPASEGGSGIVWKTKMDIPTGITEWIYPQYNFGIVPDGKYELYTQMKVSTGEVVGCVTYKWFIELTSNNGQRNYKANLAYVLDGNYSSDGNYTLQEYTPHVSSFVWTNNSGELILGSTEWTSWATDLPGYYPNYSAEDGIEVFKASSLKNTYTGEEYVGTGKYFVGHQDTTGLTGISGDFYTTRFIGFPSQSRFGSNFYLNSDYEYFRISPVTVPYEGYTSPEVDYVHISLNNPDSGDYFEAEINFSYLKYEFKIIKATRRFTNIQIGYDENSWNHGLYLKKPLNISAEGYVAVGGARAEQTQASVYSQDINEFTPIEALYVGSPVTKDNFGTILQYTGDTDANYTNGYFYKATGTKVFVPESITCQENSGYGINITCTDLTGLIEYIATNYGFSETTIRDWFKWGYGTWYYYPENPDAQKWYWNQVGDFPDSAMINFFSFDQTPENNIEWVMVNYQKGGEEIQNGHWEQINVQPGGANNTIPSVSVQTENTVWSGDPGNAGFISFLTEKRHPEVGDYLCNDNGKPIQGIIMKYGDLMVPYTGWLQIASYDENSDTATITAGGILVRDVADLSPFTINYEDV